MEIGNPNWEKEQEIESVYEEPKYFREIICYTNKETDNKGKLRGIPICKFSDTFGLSKKKGFIEFNVYTQHFNNVGNDQLIYQGQSQASLVGRFLDGEKQPTLGIQLHQDIGAPDNFSLGSSTYIFRIYGSTQDRVSAHTVTVPTTGGTIVTAQRTIVNDRKILPTQVLDFKVENYGESNNKNTTRSLRTILEKG